MFQGLDIFWNKEKIRKIIESHNSIKSSFLELLKGTAISFLIILIFSFFDFLFSKDFSLKAFGFNLYFVYMVVYIWLYCLILSFYLASAMKSYKPGQKDVIADFLTVTNKLQQKSLYIFSFVFGIYAVLIRTGKLILIPKITALSSSSEVLISLSKWIFDLFIFLVLPLMLIALIIYILSLRMQVYALKYIYNAPSIAAVFAVLFSNFAAVAMMSIISGIFTILFYVLGV